MKDYKSYEKISWETKFNTGIERIDFEHRIFLELVNSFKIALDENSPHLELVRILNEIETYAVFHFTSEENCMYAIKYPEYKKHQMLHFDLLEQFNLAKHQKLGYTKFYEFIKDWFINHTVYEDKKIKDYIEENNIDINNHLYNINL